MHATRTAQVDTTCTPGNTCRTCDTFAGMGGACTEIDYFPNATVAEYGMIDMDDTVVEKIMTEMCVWRWCTRRGTHTPLRPASLLSSILNLFCSFFALQLCAWPCCWYVIRGLLLSPKFGTPQSHPRRLCVCIMITSHD
jgi:hypothetical protein